MKEPKDYLVLPLDVARDDLALEIVERTRGLVGVFKVGLELFTSVGPSIIGKIKGISGAGVFLDLKLNDIPETVSRAIKVSKAHGVDFLTIHPDEAKEALSKVEREEREGLKILGVTVLTSLSGQKLSLLGYSEGLLRNIETLVAKRAELLWDAGVDGFVCSGQEVAHLRARFPKAVLVVPGIRPFWSVIPGEDQKRIVTPKEAIIRGADHIVVGRPILKAPDPRKAAQRILEEIEEGLRWRSKTSTP